MYIKSGIMKFPWNIYLKSYIIFLIGNKISFLKVICVCTFDFKQNVRSKINLKNTLNCYIQSTKYDTLCRYMVKINIWVYVKIYSFYYLLSKIFSNCLIICAFTTPYFTIKNYYFIFLLNIINIYFGPLLFYDVK